MSYKRDIFYFCLILVFFPASCENSQQTQNTYLDESIHKDSSLENLPNAVNTSDSSISHKNKEKETTIPETPLDKMEAQVQGSRVNTDTVKAEVISDVSPRFTPATQNIDEGVTKSVSRFPENFREYEPEDITEYPDKTPVDPSRDPEEPVTNTDQK